MTPNRVPLVLLLIFTVSGFSGLIYESIWSHYLKLFLGHAAYSQVLVLAIFMGGMAVGSALAGRYSLRWRQVLLGYAAVEAVTGVIALLFHGAFDAAMRVSFESIIPSLGSVGAVHAYKWALGAAVILPQSILLGMTFPLMSAGFLRFAPERAGRSLGMLYFTNSLGGAVGVLASGFVLIPNVGLPGAMMTAGLLNLSVALVTWLMLRKVPERPGVAAAPVAAAAMPAGAGGTYRLLLAASLVTGMASFCYEIGWLRMLSLVLGASTQAFEIMLSSFILGLALGGLWVRKRVDGAADPYRLLALVQVAMGLMALSTLYVYGQTFEWMSVFMGMFAPTDLGYAGFNWASHLIASTMMIPTTFCAGMTLPLITYAALRQGPGEKALGAVYAANTVGAILGIALAVHVLMPAMNTKGVIVVGALLDFGLGLVLLRKSAAPGRQRWMAIAAVAGFAAFAWAAVDGDVDPRKAVSGVFRYGRAVSTTEAIPYLRDGKTATVSLTRDGTIFSLATNGKIDASINMAQGGVRTEDEETQVMLGALPLLVQPEAKRAAVIGFGAGMSTHALLADPGLERVDSIEIEARMVEAAKLGFYPRNGRAYDDPRSVIHIEDAKTFFSVARSRYDIIVSEPSNPWVSGVSSLFTSEFYRNVVGHLNEGGVLVQWVQLYEIDFDSVASIMKALSPWFADYAVYVSNERNILIVASRGVPVREVDPAVFARPAVREELTSVGLASVDDVRVRRIGGKELLDPYFARSRAPVNSDYFPFIDHEAPRARYKKSNAQEVIQLIAVGLPVPEMLSASGRDNLAWGELSERNPTNRKLAQRIVRAIMDGSPRADLQEFANDVALVQIGAGDCGGANRERWDAAWKNIGRFTARYLDPKASPAFWDRLVPPACRRSATQADQAWLQLFSAVAAKSPAAMRDTSLRLIQHSDAATRPNDTMFLVAVTMLSNIALGEPGEAMVAYRELRPRLPKGYAVPFEVDWLEAIALSRLREAGGS
jgi:predicted membrane-bound spermidine synthase